MSNLANDIQRKRAESESLPSVEEWIAAGGEVEIVTDPPRQEHTMRAYTKGLTPARSER